MARPWCKNYKGMHEKEACEAGIRFQELPGYGNKGFLQTCPCFGPQEIATCDKSQYPTKDELAAREAEIKQQFANTNKARAAIVESLGGPWKKGMFGVTGAIDCPVCSCEKALRFSRAGCNGHIHAACTTEDCVCWME